MRDMASWIVPAAVAVLALGPLAAPAAAWDGAVRHGPPRALSKSPVPGRFAAWPVALSARPVPPVVILPAPVPPPLLPDPAFAPVPSVQDLPAVAGIWRTPPVEPSIVRVRR